VLLTVDLDRLDVRSGQLLLDAGCGEGRHCVGAKGRGARVVGFDLDRTALRQAGVHLMGQPGLAGFLGADARRLPFPDETFDRVICSEVMEHIDDYQAVARELYRVVKSGGRLAVTIPTATSEWIYLALSDEYFESPGGHIRIFNPRALAQALVESGFREIRAGFAHALHTPYWALRCAVGLNRADESSWVRGYRWALLEATHSPLAQRLEGLLNWVFPKSLVLYAKRDGAR